jgi:hypothetical protein
MFGMTGTPLGMYLWFGRRIVIETLKHSPYAAIKLPSEEKIIEYKQHIVARHPLLDNVWCTMDGLKLAIQKSGDNRTQNMFYNGLKCDLFVSCVFVYCPDGTIPICCYNVPGCIHDSKIADWGNIYLKLESVYNRNGGICTVDSAFSKKDKPYLLQSSQGVNLENGSRRDLRQAIAINSETTLIRQSAEWGMRSIQSSFP